MLWKEVLRKSQRNTVRSGRHRQVTPSTIFVDQFGRPILSIYFVDLFCRSILLTYLSIYFVDLFCRSFFGLMVYCNVDHFVDICICTFVGLFVYHYVGLIVDHFVGLFIVIFCRHFGWPFSTRLSVDHFCWHLELALWVSHLYQTSLSAIYVRYLCRAFLYSSSSCLLVCHMCWSFVSIIKLNYFRLAKLLILTIKSI